MRGFFMEWININSIDDLKKMGKLKPVMKMIKDDLAKLYAGKRSKDKNIVEMINVRSNSWQGLYDKIIALREVINSVDSNYINSNNKTEFQVTARKSTSYFNSLEAEYIFYLLELDGKQRADKLHITMKCYSDKAFAKSWRDSIAKIIHPDKCSNSRANDAISKLNQLYEEMVALG